MVFIEIATQHISGDGYVSVIQDAVLHCFICCFVLFECSYLDHGIGVDNDTSEILDVCSITIDKAPCGVRPHFALFHSLFQNKSILNAHINFSVLSPAYRCGGKCSECFALCCSYQPDDVRVDNHESDCGTNGTFKLTGPRVVHSGESVCFPPTQVYFVLCFGRSSCQVNQKITDNVIKKNTKYLTASPHSTQSALSIIAYNLNC